MSSKKGLPTKHFYPTPVYYIGLLLWFGGLFKIMVGHYRWSQGDLAQAIITATIIGAVIVLSDAVIMLFKNQQIVAVYNAVDKTIRNKLEKKK